MSKSLTIEEVDNGWICRKIISEAGGARIAEHKVFEKDKDKEMVAWVEKNI